MESRILEHSVNHVKMRHKCISVVPVLVSNYSSSSSSFWNLKFTVYSSNSSS